MIDFNREHFDEHGKPFKSPAAKKIQPFFVPEKGKQIPATIQQAAVVMNSVMEQLPNAAADPANRGTPLIVGNAPFFIHNRTKLEITEKHCIAMYDAQEILAMTLVLNAVGLNMDVNEARNELSGAIKNFLASHGVEADQTSRQLTRNFETFANTVISKELGKGMG